MRRSHSFWEFFEAYAAPRLSLRANTFRKIFEFLDRIEGSIIMVETGCARLRDNWQGDGQSTILFDKYLNSRDLDSVLYSVDLSRDAVIYARSQVSQRTQVTESDSIKFLHHLSDKLFLENRKINFLYLDSYDLDWDYWFPSAAHHLKELCAVMRVLNDKTLVVVDDCGLSGVLVQSAEKSFDLIRPPQIGGKGRLVAEYAGAVGANLEFAGYQSGWTGF